MIGNKSDKIDRINTRVAVENKVARLYGSISEIESFRIENLRVFIAPFHSNLSLHKILKLHIQTLKPFSYFPVKTA